MPKDADLLDNHIAQTVAQPNADAVPNTKNFRTADGAQTIGGKAVMRYGYARVSTSDQTTSLQEDALTKIGCERIFTDVISGKVRFRPGLDEALHALQPGDILTVWRLDRLGRSLSDLIDIMSIIQSKGCEFHSLTEAIDTGTASGKLIFHIIAALAEFERHLIIERTNAGLAAAKIRGVQLGRRQKLSKRQVHDLRRMVASKTPQHEILRRFCIGRTTLYRYLSDQPRSYGRSNELLS